MKNPKLHKITIKSRRKGAVLTGMNTIVEMDGKPLRGVSKLKFEVIAGGLAKVKLEMFVEECKLSEFVPIYEMASPFPAKMVKRS